MKGIFFGSTTRQLREGDVVETFGGGHRDRGLVTSIDRPAKRVTLAFGEGQDYHSRTWQPAWGAEAKGAIHVSVFMQRGDPRLGEGVYDQALAVHGEVEVRP